MCKKFVKLFCFTLCCNNFTIKNTAMKPTYKIHLIMLTLLIGAAAVAQPGKLDVILNKQVLLAKDTLDISCNYTFNGVKPKVATLHMKAVNEKGQVWNMRWPLLDGYCNPELILPAGFEPGGYKLYFSVMQNFFTVSGKVKQPQDVKEIKTILITKGGDWLAKNVNVNSDGYFELRNQLFEKEATLMFQKKTGSSDDLDIAIETMLDSVFSPMAVLVKQVFVGPLPDGVTAAAIADTLLNYDEPDSVLSAKTQMLQSVVVYGQRQSRAQKYAAEYSSGLFSTIDERLLAVMDDPNSQATGNILQYLTGRVAGLNISGAYSFSPTASWRGGQVFFYIDQMPVDIANLNNIPLADVAVIKAFPPEFLGNPIGNGGAIAVYTKRGEFSEQNARHTFKVKGYTPLSAILPVMPDSY
jgi:hypothetical protein